MLVLNIYECSPLEGSSWEMLTFEIQRQTRLHLWSLPLRSVAVLTVWAWGIPEACEYLFHRASFKVYFLCFGQNAKQGQAWEVGENRASFQEEMMPTPHRLQKKKRLKREESYGSESQGSPAAAHKAWLLSLVGGHQMRSWKEMAEAWPLPSVCLSLSHTDCPPVSLFRREILSHGQEKKF